MYSPKNNSKWLDTTMKTLEASIQMYKILKVKDERFNMVCHFIVREVIDAILNLPGVTLMDRVVDKAETLTVLYNKEIADMFIRSGITEKFLKDSDFKIVFKKDNILLLVRYLLECINPNSVVYHRFVYELELMKNLNKGKNGRFNIVWKINKDELTPFIASDYEADCKAIKSHIMTPVDFYNVMMYVNTNKFIIYLTNMGSYFHNNEDAKKYVYTIPYCFVLKAMCFLTGLGHIGDGTACGYNAQLNYDNTI
jgi:hypothetical protein